MIGIQQVLRRPLSRGFSSIPYPAHILTSPATDVSKTSNGVRVASETAHGETATIEVWIDAGSRNETEKNNGASNFLTKLAFNGTTNMPHSQQVKEMASIGNRISAYTTREHTVYTAKVSKDHVAKAMALLADMIQNPILDDSLLLDTRAESLCELDMMHQDHAQSVWEHLHETAFMGTGLSQTKYGVQHTIATLNAADIGAFKSSQYSADRFVIAAAGAVDHANLLALTEKHFGQVPALPSGSLVIPYDAAIFTGSDKRIRFDSMGLAHIALGFQGASATSEHAFPLMIMKSLLGSWSRTSSLGLNSASKFAQEVAEYKIAHSYSTFNASYKDTGIFGIHMVCKDNTIEDAMWYALNNLVRCCHNVSDGEVERAKTHLKSQLLLPQCTFSGTADDIGRQMLTYGRRMSNAELFARIDSVTTSELKATASKFINDEDHALAAIGPIFELPDYNWIRRRSYWHRY